MHKNDITEQDIFYYVNFPDSLSPEKREFIKRNENLFKSDIEFCKESQFNLPDSVIEKINSFGKTETIINLFPLKVDIEEPVREIVLAADSAEKDSHIKVDTFIDEDNQFLLKVLSSDNRKKFYCYNSTGELLKDFYLTVFPSKSEYHLKNDSEWIEFANDTILESIKIKIQP